MQRGDESGHVGIPLQTPEALDGLEHTCCDPSQPHLPATPSAHGTGKLARRIQGIESDTRYDTRRSAPDGAFARMSQTTVCDTCGSAPPACGRLPADLRTHPGWAQGRADATAAGRSRCRKPRCGWPRPRWRTATPPCPSSAVNSGFSAAGRCTDVYVLVRISTFDVASCDT